MRKNVCEGYRVEFVPGIRWDEKKQRDGKVATEIRMK